MKKQIEMMEEFHRAFGHPINKPPDHYENLDDLLSAMRLRVRIQEEENEEFMSEIWSVVQNNKISSNLLKEASDLLYVLLGTLVALGVADKFEEAFTRVHISNMSKLDENGKPIYRDDGKVLKGPNYRPPELGDLV